MDDIEYFRGRVDTKITDMDIKLNDIGEDLKHIRSQLDSLRMFKARVYGVASTLAVGFSYIMHKIMRHI